MKLEGEHVFKGPRAMVWDMVRDPDVLATALPGSQKFTKISDQEYEASMNVRVGPVSGVFEGKLLVTNENAPESCTLSVDGKGAAGFARGLGNVHLTDLGDGTTLMKYDGEMEVGGKLASVGQRLLDTVSKSMVSQGFKALDAALEARVAAAAGGETAAAVSEYKAPSEAEFAAEVAKDVAKGWLQTAEVRMVLYVIPLVIIFLIVSYLLNANK